MKLFIYKPLFIFFLIFSLFKLKIESIVKKYEKKIDTYFSKANLDQLKQKVREEMQNAIEKKNYLKPEVSELINKFLKKLQSEILFKSKKFNTIFICIILV